MKDTLFLTKQSKSDSDMYVSEMEIFWKDNLLCPVISIPTKVFPSKFCRKHSGVMLQRIHKNAKSVGLTGMSFCME